MKTSFRRLSISILTLLALLLSVSGVTSVHAAGTVVSNTNDSGAGSLRQAIADAGAGATITFAAGLSGRTINLASVLLLSKNVTINGSALAQPITISGDTAPANGSADVRVFRVNTGVTATLNGLVITKGKSSGIYNSGTLTVIKSTISGSSAHQGGGIYNSGTLTVTNSTISGNAASQSSPQDYEAYGGGIYNNGTLTVTNSTISDNSAPNASYGGSGGGIYNDKNILAITGSTISGNAAYSGGGIYNNRTITTITNSKFSGNFATNSGGGIDNNGAMTIANSSIFGNSADSGGGIDNNASYIMVTIKNSSISGNSADYGGGISNEGSNYDEYIISQPQLTITNSTISGNAANNTGAGIYNAVGALIITNSTISGNTATETAGGIYNIRLLSDLTITNSTLFGNSASDGGGIYNFYNYNYPNNLKFIMNNTIIAGSPSGGDCTGATSAGSNNLVQDGSCDATLSGDPKLGPLASNGGPTKTLALLAGSPAIDAGNDTICAAAPVNKLDQRGVARPAGAHCDIGAYEVVPVTLTLNPIAAQDGWVLESSESSSVGGSMYSVGPGLAIGDNAAKQEYRSILSFNTSSLPDTAVISGVTLNVKKQAIVGGGDPITAFQGLLVGMSKGTIGAAALEVSDFQAPAGTLTPFGPFMPVPVNDWYSIDLSNGGKAYINKLASNNGLTQIRLRFKLDDNNDAVANYLSLYSGDAINATDRPQLVITYVP